MQNLTRQSRDIACNEQSMLLLRVRDSRDRAAFSELFDFFAPRLKSMLLCSGIHASRADDIVQDVMLTVWRKAAQFDPARAQASSWIYRIARNRHIDIVRKESRPVPEELTIAEQIEDDASQMLEFNQEAERLRSALTTLGDDQREIIEKAYLGELTHDEIRQTTGLPLGTVKSRIRLALGRLRYELKDLRQ